MRATALEQAYAKGFATTHTPAYSLAPNSRANGLVIFSIFTDF
jgi:hypothetical protein